MYTLQDFEDIRPYYDEEINPALKRITAIAEFGKILDFFFPKENKEDIIRNLLNIHSALSFQKQFMHPLVSSIVNKTSEGLTTSGFELLTPGTPYLFVANHRDIVLDSAILQVILLDYGHETSEITFGSNLMANQFIIDLGRVNRMFKVNRGGNRMELFRNSRILSSYIRYTLTEKKTSAWIAQRSGRTKDGSDKTETGLLKMFNISGTSDIKASFSELNILPLSISYEYEPCCALKIKELISLNMDIPYVKEPGEDLMSIIKGITQPKGHIHLAACNPLNELLDITDECHGTNEKINKLVSVMDEEIYRNYRLWPTNYVAYDLLHQTKRYHHLYTPGDVASFEAYIQSELSGFTGDLTLPRELLLNMYSNPVINALSVAKA